LLSSLLCFLWQELIKIKYNAGSVEKRCIFVPKCLQLWCSEEQPALVPEEVDSSTELWVGGFTPEKEFYTMMRDGRISLHVARVEEVTSEDTVRLSNGETVTGVGDIIFGTGWKQGFPFLPIEVLEGIGIEQDGTYLYRHMVHPAAPGIAWVGANISTLSNTLTHSIQAKWLLGLLQGSHELPDRVVMLEEVEALKAWKREVLPMRNDRGSTIMLHQLHYHEELLEDLAEETCLKQRGACCLVRYWYELVQAYLPADYAPVLRQDAAEEAGYYERIPAPYQLRGHQEGNGYLVTIYVVCFCGALASVTVASAIFFYSLVTHTGIFKFLDD